MHVSGYGKPEEEDARHERQSTTGIPKRISYYGPMSNDPANRTGDPTANAGVAPPEFRAPPGTTVGRVRLQVSDLERSLGFYTDVLGFRVLEQDGNQAVLGTHEGAAGREPTPLIELVERPGANAVPPRGRLGLFHFAVLLPERAQLGRILRHFAERGVRLGSSDHLVSEALYLSDPDGLGIEIYADRPRSAWRRQGQEIALATEPLAARDLLEAAGAMPWQGIPSGTTMGHIHLSVDDIDRAEAFFHVGLGLDKIVWSYPGALFLAAGGYHHHVGTNAWARGAPVAGEEDARLLEWRLVYPDAQFVSAALESVANAGFADAVDPSGARVRDPWGVWVRLTDRG